jgi:diguanylate cyclase (GGDEF)-like protein/PAS domain S-box-containing protein
MPESNAESTAYKVQEAGAPPRPRQGTGDSEDLGPLLSSVPDALFFLSPEGVIQSFNPSFPELLGRDPATLAGTPVSALLADADASVFPDVLRREAVRGRTASGRLTFRGPRGEALPLSYRASSVRTRQGRRLGFLVTGDRCRDEHQAAGLGRLSDENPFPVLRASRDGTLMYANRGSWLLLSHWHTDIGQPLPAEWVRVVQDVLTTGEGREVEVEAGFKTVLLAVVPVQAEGYANFFGLDLTAHKHIEQKLRLNSQVFENSSEGMAITDADFRVLDVNGAFSVMTGYSREEILGEPISLIRSERHEDDFLKELWRMVKETGSWHGEIWPRRKDGGVFPTWLSLSSVTDAKTGQISRYIGTFSDISTIKATQEQLYRMAHYDSLTGLANRRCLQERLDRSLQHARRSGSVIAVLFLDLDNFKLVNDNMGHRAGDQLLMEVADRLKGCTRDSDTVARMGGDEFTIVLTDIRSLHGAMLVAQKILKRLVEPVLIEQREVFVSASIGIALYPEDASGAEGLVKSADIALSQAKSSGKNGYQFFSREMNIRAVERLTLVTRMRQGLERGEFVVHYQPMVASAGEEFTGVEALVRWDNPEMGLVPPDRFIPVAEESGIIHDLGEKVLRDACLQWKRWVAEGLPPCRLAVNVSAHQIDRPNFVSLVEATLNETGVPAGNLELELTESILISDMPRVIGILERLKALGVSLAIDDFGTKYSSLAYLKRLPIDRIKIDRSFVRDMGKDDGSRELAGAIIAMGRSMNLEVTAEGVETAEQAAILRDKGCQYMQGFHFSRPVPSAELFQWVSRRSGEGGSGGQ